MKLKEIKILLLFLLFQIVFNEPYSIKNFEEITFPVGTTEYTYQFLEPSLQRGKSVYFFFKFSFYYKIELKVIDEDKNENAINVTTEFRYLYFNVKNLKTQKYTFILTNNYKEQKMIFIDNSKEINTNPDEFFQLIFSTESMKENPPLPLIFNMDTIKEKIIGIFYENKDGYTIYDGYSYIDYCEIDEDNRCNFVGSNNILVLEKCKRYKLKLNCYKNHLGNYLFLASLISSVTKEINFGLTYNTLCPKVEYYNFIINVRNYDNFNLYVQHNYMEFSKLFLTEDEKNAFLENRKDFYFNYGLTNSILNLNSEKEYLIIRIRNYYSPYTGFIYIFSVLYNINYEESFEIKKGNYAIISKESDSNNDKKYILLSSQKNMVLFGTSFNNSKLTDLIFLDNSKENILIYVDSSKEKSKFKYYIYDE